MALEPFEVNEDDAEVVVTTANYTKVVAVLSNHYLPHEELVEGFLLMLLGILGMLLNLVVLILTFSCSHLRIMMNGFTVHGCFLEIIMSGLCIPFAWTLLSSNEPGYCAMLGTAYIIVQTSALFNLLAMVLAEAYTFHVHNLNEKDPDREGAFMCVLFGIVMIYTGTIIIHLGPTLIGGHFVFNEDIGNCLFAYGEIKTYIVQAMWIGIVTLIFLIIYRYIYKFYRLLKRNEQFRITALARNAAAMGRGGGATESIYDIVYRLKRKVKVLLGMALITTFCWYPLFILTLVDVHYVKQRYMYRILTVIAWSHSTLMPLPLLFVDKSFGVCFQFKRIVLKYKISGSATGSVAGSPDPRRRLLQHQSIEKSTPPMYPSKLHLVSDYKTGNGHHSTRLAQTKALNVNDIRNYGGVSNSTPPVPPSQRDRSGIAYSDRMQRELDLLRDRSPLAFDMNNLESRINQSRETDLLYDNTSLPDYDML